MIFEKCLATLSREKHKIKETPWTFSIVVIAGTVFLVFLSSLYINHQKKQEIDNLTSQIGTKDATIESLQNQISILEKENNNLSNMIANPPNQKLESITEDLIWKDISQRTELDSLQIEVAGEYQISISGNLGGATIDFEAGIERDDLYPLPEVSHMHYYKLAAGTWIKPVLKNATESTKASIRMRKF